MTLNQHLALTGVAAAALFPFCSLGEIAIFAVGSVLIDVDHYFLYVQRTGRFDMGGMFRWYEDLWKIEKTIPYVGPCIFHTIEFFIIVALLALVWPLMFFLLAGLLFHFIVDLAYLIHKRIPFIRPYSLIEHLIRRRDPKYPYY